MMSIALTSYRMHTDDEETMESGHLQLSDELLESGFHPCYRN